MCQVYVKTDPINYESRSHSVRIHNVVTTIRLENEFWTILGVMASSEGKTTNELIATLYDEVTAFRGELDNFASFLRVSCARFLKIQAESLDTSESSQDDVESSAVTLVPRRKVG